MAKVYRRLIEFPFNQTYTEVRRSEIVQPGIRKRECN